MENSAPNTAREEAIDDMTTQMLAHRIKRELRLREVVEQSAFGFYIGGWKLSGIIRMVGVLGVVIIYIRSGAFASTGLWPLFAIGAFLEAFRANSRLDAMLVLELMEEQIHPANTGKPESRSGSAHL